MANLYLLAALVPLSLYLFLLFAKEDDVLKGTVPIMTNDWKFFPSDIPDLSGKVVIVTGANTGLGKSTAKLIASRKAKVIMGCRSIASCKTAMNEIKMSYDYALDISVMRIDLSSLKSVKEFSDELHRSVKHIDSLILNAGVMHTSYTLSEDGYELQFAVNHLGHFYLTQLLMDMLNEPSTIVSVSSNGHFYSYSSGVKLTVEDLNDPSSYDPIKAYGQSKLCNVLFAQELAERMDAQGKKVYVNSLNPGGVMTDLLRQYPEWVQNLAKSTMSRIFWKPDEGCLTQVYLAVSPEVILNQIQGKYYVPIAEPCGVSSHAKDKTLQKKLWEFSEELVSRST